MLVSSGMLLAQTPSGRQAHPCEKGRQIDEMRCLASQLPLAKTSSSCAAQAPNGWKTYIDRAHGFCFSYPPVYKQTRQPWLEQNDNLRKAAKEDRMLDLERAGDEGASIFVLLEDVPFDLESFVKGAPTGIEYPPEPLQVGGNTFYYYGAGGGGVQYADQYCFNLRGRTLGINFDGPYENDNSPSYEAKQMEVQILATFRAVNGSARK
jgi:hypothetical protein